MATDATGTPTAKGIPKYDTANDAPSGLGFNAAMDAIDTILDDYVEAPSGLVSGEAMVWNGSAWVRSSVTRINTIRPQDLGQDGASSGQILTWDGSKWAPAAPTSSGVVEVFARDSTVFDNTNLGTSEQTHWTKSIDANTIQDGGMLRLTAWGDLLYNGTVNSDAITWRVKFGGTTFVVNTMVDGGQISATRKAWHLTATIMATSTSTQIGTGLMLIDKPSTGTISSSWLNTGAVDLTAAQNLVLTSQWNASSTARSFKSQGYVIEVV